MRTCTNCNESRTVAAFYNGATQCKNCVRTLAASNSAARRERRAAALSALTFGVELEMSTLSPRAAHDVLSMVLGGVDMRDGVRVADGRIWRAVSDGTPGVTSEVVSPILRFNSKADMETLQRVARALRAAGGRASHACCGVHVHIGVAALGGVPGGARCAVFAGSIESKVRTGIAIDQRRAGWCRALETSNLNAFRLVTNAAELERAMPQGYSGRYTGINLKAIAKHKTCEFRWFNGTLHAGKIRAYVNLCAGIALKSIEASTVKIPRVADDEAGMVKTCKWLGIKDASMLAHLTEGFVDAATQRARLRALDESPMQEGANARAQAAETTATIRAEAAARHARVGEEIAAAAARRDAERVRLDRFAAAERANIEYNRAINARLERLRRQETIERLAEPAVRYENI